MNDISIETIIELYGFTYECKVGYVDGNIIDLLIVKDKDGDFYWDQEFESNDQFILKLKDYFIKIGEKNVKPKRKGGFELL